MPANHYNPYILGFVHRGGGLDHVWLPLREALTQFGELPSRYGLLSQQTMRNERPVLNLRLGIAVESILRRTPDLKRDIFSFYEGWHRDWRQEFGVDVRPLFNRNDPQQVLAWIARQRSRLRAYETFAIRDELAGSGLIRKDVLNSIADQALAAKALEMLQRRQRQWRDADGEKRARLAQMLRSVRLRLLLDRFQERSGCRLSAADEGLVAVYADETAGVIGDLCAVTGTGCQGIRLLSGQGIEFAYAGRDRELLTLGSDIGDCTAKPYRQIDRHTENIYWTLFPWLLDRNYLILKVLYQGHLVAKAHLLPLATYEQGDFHLFLAVDAIETDVTMRPDIPGGHKIPQPECRVILEHLAGEILRIAGAMGIADVYAELFSNNPLVRDWLEGMERIYLDVTGLHKVDELEDVYAMAATLTERHGRERPDHIFMEIQFRNMQLMSHQTQRRNIKGFARLRQGRLSGYAMGEVIGI